MKPYIVCYIVFNHKKICLPTLMMLVERCQNVGRFDDILAGVKLWPKDRVTLINNSNIHTYLREF